MRDAEDGASDALLIAEIRQVPDKDNDHREFRGLLWYPWGATFSAYNGPNSSNVDYIGWTNYCNNKAEYPCSDSANNGTAYMAARSRCSGGVNARLGDGSVRFVSDTISLDVQRAASTTKGGQDETSVSF